LVNIPNTNTYKFRLLIYRDNRQGTVAMPNSFTFATYLKSTNVNANLNFTVNRVSKYIANYDPTQCIPPIARSSVEIGVFEYTLTALQAAQLSNNAGYYFSSTFCCRNVGAKNILGQSSSYGINFCLDIPKLSTGTYQYNSSPIFKTVPNNMFYVGTHYSLDWSCVDADGDSLSYSLMKPTDGNSDFKPFGTVEYKANYTLPGNIIDGNPDLTYNATSGIVDFTPTQIGSYLLAFKVAEWRKVNGVWVNIGNTYRELQFECYLNSQFPPVLVNDKNKGGTIRDTINVIDTATYITKFITHDEPGDSIFMYIEPEAGLYNNIFNSNLFDIQWGKDGAVPFHGSAINNKILIATDSLKTTFKWKIDSTDIKKIPYKFKVISKDGSYCSGNHSDTLDFEIYVLGDCQKKINFTFTGCDSVVDHFNNVHYSSNSTIDTVKAIIGCDTIITQSISVYPKAIKNRINGSSAIQDTSQTYIYGTDPQAGMQFDWSISHGTIISGQGTNIVEVRYNSSSDTAHLKYVAYNNLLCADSSSLLIYIFPLGVQNNKINAIKVFPNPAYESIRIENLPIQGINTIRIMNMQGKKIIEQDVIENEKIDISKLAKGIYILKIGERVQKFVKL